MMLLYAGHAVTIVPVLHVILKTVKKFIFPSDLSKPSYIASSAKFLIYSS